MRFFLFSAESLRCVLHNLTLMAAGSPIAGTEGADTPLEYIGGSFDVLLGMTIGDEGLLISSPSRPALGKTAKSPTRLCPFSVTPPPGQSLLFADQMLATRAKRSVPGFHSLSARTDPIS